MLAKKGDTSTAGGGMERRLRIPARTKIKKEITIPFL